MEQFKIITLSNVWSSKNLTRKVEQELKTLSAGGYEIISVNFSFNYWWILTAYITVKKTIKY